MSPVPTLLPMQAPTISDGGKFAVVSVANGSPIYVPTHVDLGVFGGASEADLLAEVARAEAAEAALLADVNAEAARAEAAEAAEAAARAAADTAEAAARSAADATLTSNLASEVVRAEAAEAVLLGDVGAETSRAEAAEAVIAGTVTAEASARAAADTALLSDVTAETSRAEAAETALSGSVTAEVAARVAGDALALKIAQNLADIANAATARSNLGLGTAATHAASDFDAAGAALAEQVRALAAEALLAPLANPAFSGHPTGVTELTSDNSIRLATTAFVHALAAASLPINESDVTGLVADLAAKLAKTSNLADLTDMAAARGNLGLGSAATHASTDFDASGAAATEQARALAAEALLAPIAGPVLTGDPHTPDQADGDNDQSIANTKFVQRAIVLLGLGSASTHAASDFSPSATTRAITMGLGGSVNATVTNAADFLMPVPAAMTLTRMKVTAKSAPTGAMTVQLRRSTNGGSTWSDVTGFLATFTGGAFIATVDPADVAVNEGDLLNFSVATGSGSNVIVEAIGTMTS